MLSVLGKTMLVGASLFILPIIVALCYGEQGVYLSYIIPMAVLVAVGAPLVFFKDKENHIRAKEGFVIVALVWIILSLVGCLPFIISGAIPSFADAFFETVSGFTTTGASILTDAQVEAMYANQKSLMFWRLFTHWIGGMGVLVFVLAVLPKSETGAMHIFRSEAPGPSSSKFVSKMRHTARILYAIYFVMTAIECVLLLFSGIGFYDSLLNSFSTAGTGGLAIRAGSIAYYNSAYVEMVIAVFMFLFAINFNVYYLVLIGQFKKIFKSEEFIGYILLTLISTLLIAVNLTTASMTFVEGLRYGFFQVTSISSTTGFSSIDFDKVFPTFSKAILLILMMIGACGGSTGGGIKLSRIILLFKFSKSDVKKMIHPRAVYSVKMDGEKVTEGVEKNVRSFLIIWIIVVCLSTLLLSLDGFSDGDVYTNFTATLACIGNVGPGFNLVGPAMNYSGYSDLSTTLLSFVMLLGRLELFPMLILFSPRTWKKSE